MQNSSVWGRASGLTRTVVEGVRFDETSNAIVVSVRPNARARSRCGRCGRRSRGYDQGAGRRRWRSLDAGTTRVFIEAAALRVECRAHGPTVVQVPWARRDVGHTRDFDAMAAWLAVTRRSLRRVTCCGWRGEQSGRSSPASTRMSKLWRIAFRVCAGSGSVYTQQRACRSWLLCGSGRMRLFPH